MLEVDQTICNRIAEQNTNHTWMNELLKIKSQMQAWQAEDNLWFWVKKEAERMFPKEEMVPLLVAPILPALMENEAITAFLEKAEDFLGAIPMVSTPDGAAELAGMDKNLSPDEPAVKKAAQMLKEIQEGRLKPDLTSILPQAK